MMKTKDKRFTPFESPEWSLREKQESELNQKTGDFFSQSVNGKQTIKNKSLWCNSGHATLFANSATRFRSESQL